MPRTLHEALETSWSAIEGTNNLAEQGWRVEDSLRSVLIQGTGVDGKTILDTSDQLAPLAIDADLVTDSGFRLGITDSRLVVLAAPDHPTDHYEGNQLLAAERLLDGDIQAIRGLGEKWDVRLVVDLARPLAEAEPGIHWRVVRSVDVALNTVKELGWGKIGDLAKPSDPLHIVVLRPGPIRWMSPTFGLVSPDFVEDPLPPSPDRKAATVKSASGSKPPDSVLLPEALISVGDVVNDGGISIAMGAFAAASAWAWLADDVALNADGSATLDFFGWRHSNVTVPSQGIASPDGQRAAIDLYRWVTAEESPDRFLAVKQVLSVYSDDRYLEGGDDVRRGAEPLYRSLRSSIVAEVVASQRETRRMAAEAAREASMAVLAAAKSVSERTIAALIALGGLSIASATSTTLPSSLINQLAFAVGVFMVALTLWAILIEGPTIALPVSALESDLGELDELIGPDIRQQILSLTVVTLAKRRATIIRVASPIVYLAIAALALALAHPYPLWIWG